MAQDKSIVKHNPNGQTTAAGYSGGGPIPWSHVPCFSGSGSSVEVHFFNEVGEDVLVETYTLTSAAVGALGLTRSGGTFLTDCPPTAVGYEAFARGGPVSCGRAGSEQPQTGGTYVNPLVSVPTPYTMVVGQALRWCLLADSHGFTIEYNSEGDGGDAGDLVGSTYVNGALSNTKVNVKTTPGILKCYAMTNPDAAQPACVEFFDALAANVSLGTTVPRWFFYLNSAMACNISDLNIAFATAISMVSVSAYNGSSAPNTATLVSVGFN